VEVIKARKEIKTKGCLTGSLLFLCEESETSNILEKVVSQ